MEMVYARLLSTAREQPRIRIRGAGRFGQEERGEKLTGRAHDLAECTPGLRFRLV